MTTDLILLRQRVRTDRWSGPAMDAYAAERGVVVNRGAAIARAYIYADDENPFVLPVDFTDAEIAEARRVTLHWASMYENAPWRYSGDLERADEILRTLRAAERLREAPMKEWQVAEGSMTAHVIDTSKPSWKNEDGSRRRNGPRSECGRYPQRNAEFPWFSLSVTEPGVYDALRIYHCIVCPDCKEKADA